MPIVGHERMALLGMNAQPRTVKWSLRQIQARHGPDCSGWSLHASSRTQRASWESDVIFFFARNQANTSSALHKAGDKAGRGWRGAVVVVERRRERAIFSKGYSTTAVMGWSTRGRFEWLNSSDSQRYIMHATSIFNPPSTLPYALCP